MTESVYHSSSSSWHRYHIRLSSVNHTFIVERILSEIRWSSRLFLIFPFDIVERKTDTQKNFVYNVLHWSSSRRSISCVFSRVSRCYFPTLTWANKRNSKMDSCSIWMDVCEILISNDLHSFELKFWQKKRKARDCVTRLKHSLFFLVVVVVVVGFFLLLLLLLCLSLLSSSFLIIFCFFKIGFRSPSVLSKSLPRSFSAWLEKQSTNNHS